MQEPTLEHHIKWCQGSCTLGQDRHFSCLLLAPAHLCFPPACLLLAPARLCFPPACLLLAPAHLCFPPACLLLAPPFKCAGTHSGTPYQVMSGQHAPLVAVEVLIFVVASCSFQCHSPVPHMAKGELFWCESGPAVVLMGVSGCFLRCTPTPQTPGQPAQPASLNFWESLADFGEGWVEEPELSFLCPEGCTCIFTGVSSILYACMTGLYWPAQQRRPEKARKPFFHVWKVQ